MSQLERDIERRIHERLRLWINDSIELYRMAGLSFTNYYPAIAYALIQATVAMFVAVGLNRNEAHEILKEIMDGAYDRAIR
jgi:hypothetical protein